MNKSNFQKLNSNQNPKILKNFKRIFKDKKQTQVLTQFVSYERAKIKKNQRMVQIRIELERLAKAYLDLSTKSDPTSLSFTTVQYTPETKKIIKQIAIQFKKMNRQLNDLERQNDDGYESSVRKNNNPFFKQAKDSGVPTDQLFHIQREVREE